MVEIAICLAIIGIALVAIIGVLPVGINVQKDNRQETVIDQDASVFIENIRNGTLGPDDLTNYVLAITNTWTSYNNSGAIVASGVNGYTYAGFFVSSQYPTPGTPPGASITNGANIIGLLSTPEYMDPASGQPLLYPTGSYISNYVVAYVRSLSGSAAEKPPQDNDIIRGDSFSYKLVCQNVSVATYIPPFWQGQSYSAGSEVYYTNGPGSFWLASATTGSGDVPGSSPVWVEISYPKQLTANLRELRLTFLWPLLPNGNTGNGRQTFRTSVGGQLVVTNDYNNKELLYLFQPQSFVSAP